MKALKIAGGVLALLLLVLLVNTFRVKAAPKAPPVEGLAGVDEKAAAKRLAGALRIPTVTVNEREKVKWSEWPKLHDYLERQFPRAHRTLKRERIARLSLLYTWKGSDEAAAPMLMLAHQDVVPVEPGTEKTWEQPPFDGVVGDGFVWGRGALDDKSSLVAQLEAVEWLVASGFKPKRSVYFAFGHDEEIGGREGAVAIAAELEKRGIKAEFSLDEGGSITRGVVKGVAAPVASIMTGEKGYASFRLTARDQGGHSSRPGTSTAVGSVARAVARLERRQFRPQLPDSVRDMLVRLAPEYAFGRRLAIANLWLTEPLVVRSMTRSGNITNAMVRTTTAPTMFNAGIKDNVLPVEASAVVNFRILPGGSVADVERHIRRVVDDPAIEVAGLDFSSEPSAPASDEAPAFQLLERTVNEIYPEAVVTAGLVIGATDNRHYGAVREQRYNFAPAIIQEDDLARVHGANERIATADYARMIQFYVRFLENAAGG